MVMVEDPAPVIDVGLKAAETRVPSCLADKVIGELKPPVAVVVTVTLPTAPLAIVMEVGDALTVNPLAADVTVSETIAVSTVLPALPLTVIG